jgi:hypothetical protein
MAWTFVNTSNVPVNIGLYNAGILYQWKNKVQPYSSATAKALPANEVDANDWPGLKLLKDDQGRVLEPIVGDGGCVATFETAGVGYDIAILYDVPGSELDSSQNWRRITEIVGITIGAIVGAVGVALLWVPVAGEAVTIAGIEIAAGAIATTGVVSTAAGTVLTLGDIALEIADTVMSPSKFIDWYGGKDYAMNIQGGFEYNRTPDGKPPADGKIHITNVVPITLEWTNVDTNEGGTAKPDW